MIAALFILSHADALPPGEPTDWATPVAIAMILLVVGRLLTHWLTPKRG